MAKDRLEGPEMGRPGHERSAVEIRRGHITRQLDRLRDQLAQRSPSHYANENAYQRQLKRLRELISELDGGLLMLDCPGEYDELPVAVVADEMGLKYEQVSHQECAEIFEQAIPI